MAFNYALFLCLMAGLMLALLFARRSIILQKENDHLKTIINNTNGELQALSLLLEIHNNKIQEKIEKGDLAELEEEYARFAEAIGCKPIKEEQPKDKGFGPWTDCIGGRFRYVG